MVVKDLKKYCEKFKLGSIGRKDDLKNKVRGHWFTGKSQKTFPEVVQAAIARQLDVVFADSGDQIVDLEDFEVIGDLEEEFDGVDSDEDDVVNFEELDSTFDSDDGE